MPKYNFTSETLKSTLEEIFTNKVPKERDFTMWSHCYTKGGLVKRNVLDLNLCTDRKCVGCQQIRKAFKDGANSKG
jgi:hypothetical protein